jgi:hypothetical protein
MTVAFHSDKKYGQDLQDRFDSYELWTRFVTQLLILRGVPLVKFKQTLSTRRRGTGPPFLFVVMQKIRESFHQCLVSNKPFRHLYIACFQKIVFISSQTAIRETSNVTDGLVI